MATTTTPPNTVAARITYVLPPPDGVRPYQLVDPKSGVKEENVVLTAHDVLIENIRGKEHLYTLDNAGFQFYKRPTKHTFSGDKEIEEYYRESTETIKELTGASRVLLYDPREFVQTSLALTMNNMLSNAPIPTVRRRRRTGEDVDDSMKNRQPAAQVHVDISAASSIAQVHHRFPSEAPDLLRRRFQIINLWRPIGNPAYDSPVAFCTYNSVDPKRDTFPVARLHQGYEGEALGIKYSPNHQWKYLRGMTPDEMVLIKKSVFSFF